jgi:peptide/nickel transport system ATP-binding protein
VRGLVGESGAGKSMIGKAVLGILPPSVEVTEGARSAWTARTCCAAAARTRDGGSAREIALIPQDPLTALNPSRRIGPQMTDRLVDIAGWTRRERRCPGAEAAGRGADPRSRAGAALLSARAVGRHAPARADRRRLCAEPKLIVADEPTTALDVTVQKQILRLIAACRPATAPRCCS